MRSFVKCVTFAISLAALAGAGSAAAGSLEDLGAARSALAKRDYGAAVKSAGAAVAAGDLKGEELASAYFVRGYAKAFDNKREDAVQDFTEALKHTEKGGNPWVGIVNLRYLANLDLKRWSDAASDFVLLAKERPVAARAIRYRILSRMVWELEKENAGALFDVLKAVRDVAYAPDEAGQDLDYMTIAFAQMLAERDEPLIAMMELSKVKNADLLVKARSDRRFASLWTQKDFDDITNPHEIAARDLAHKAEMAKRFPNIAMVMMRYASALRAVGESEKAVAVAREALANPELTSTNKERELEDKLWLRNELVYALKDLGRTEEMFSEMQPILKLDETKSAAMVAQLINFGEIMSEFDRGAEGLKTAQRAWNIASPLGKMFVHMVDVCVNAETDKAAAEKALSLLRKEQSENYAAMTEALLCMDKTDDVAALLKKRLASPELRSAVLSAAQTYKQPTFVTPTRRKLMDRYAKVLARSDVQSAIKKYGRLETYPFVASYWGNF